MPADALTTNHMPLRLQSSQQQKKDLLSPSQLVQHEMGGGSKGNCSPQYHL